MASSFEDAFKKAKQLQNEKSKLGKSDEAADNTFIVKTSQDNTPSKAIQAHSYKRNEVSVSHRKKPELHSTVKLSDTFKKYSHRISDTPTIVVEGRHGTSRKKNKIELDSIRKSDHINGRRASKLELLVLKDNIKTTQLNLDCYGSIPNPQKLKPILGKISSDYNLEIASITKSAFDTQDPSADIYNLILNEPLIEHHNPPSNAGGDRQITLGFDFGTSCVKCIIGDGTIKHAYAIPFLKGVGINTYLLPSVLYEESGMFSLQKKNISYNNLKLGFLENPQSQDMQILMIAFMSLVIRQSISWFLHEYKTTYVNNKINWALSIGVPVPQGADDKLSRQYAHIARAAWYVAWNKIEVSKQEILIALKRSSTYNDYIGPQHPDEEVEIHAIPEIAAQILGFIEGNSFDPNARNIYLMVDVGAGTVDSSLFHVKKVRDKSKFSFYESKVGSFGVMNLHRKRLDWWKVALSKKGEMAKGLLESVEENMLSTDSKIIPPKQLEDYFIPSKLTFTSDNYTPDHKFRIALNSMIIQSYRSSFKNCNPQVLKNNLYGIEAFLCGGGFKMPFYKFIEKSIDKVANASYLHAIPKPLLRPSNFTADVHDNDYNRLSVAYGLSFIRAEIANVLPMEKEITATKEEWNMNFISKDQT